MDNKHRPEDISKYKSTTKFIIISEFIIVLLVLLLIIVGCIGAVRASNKPDSDFPKILIYEHKNQTVNSTISVGLEGGHLDEVKRIVNDDGSVSITLVFREEE